ncbi:MAG: hypothetical protein IJD60_09905 [Clostridia bacterium]|nr:hypothetical protein [Clostridia bacterium]
MAEKRNALVDVIRVAAAVGIIMGHVDMAGLGAAGVLLGQFLSVRFALMFFLALIGFYLEKAYQAGKKPVRARVGALARVYAAWSLVYLALSFVMLVLVERMPLGQYLASRIKGFFFSGSYYHFWFYPAVIYALLLIGGVKRLLGHRSLSFLVPLAAALYTVGLLGTGYLPIGRQIPGLRTLYAAEEFEAVMHLVFLGFPSVVFGMAAARESAARTGRTLLAAAAAYAAECIILCLFLSWREDPQMLISTPLLTVLFLRWLNSGRLTVRRVDPQLCRTLSSAMYNVHPLLLAAFALVLPGLDGLWAFLLCVTGSAAFGWALYCLRKIRFFALFI